MGVRFNYNGITSMELFHMARKDKHEKVSPAPEDATDRPVVIAIDFSDDSKAALAWGMEEAALRNAPATILHVIHDPGDAPGYYHKKQKKIMVPLTEAAEQIFDEFIDECRSEIPALQTKDDRPVRRKLAKGSRFGAFWNSPRNGCADDRHGQPGADRNQAPAEGSKAEQVVRLSPIPVMIVKAQATKKSE